GRLDNTATTRKHLSRNRGAGGRGGYRANDFGRRTLSHRDSEGRRTLQEIREGHEQRGLCKTGDGWQGSAGQRQEGQAEFRRPGRERTVQFASAAPHRCVV